MRTLKRQERKVSSVMRARRTLERLSHFIEEVYNIKRLHSSLGYMSPEKFEYKFNNNKIRTRQLVLT